MATPVEESEGAECLRITRVRRGETNSRDLLDALTALVEPERLVQCRKKWYGWRERDQVLLYLTVGYGEANAWVASADVRALDHEMARLRELLPERSPEDTCQVAI